MITVGSCNLYVRVLEFGGIRAGRSGDVALGSANSGLSYFLTWFQYIRYNAVGSNTELSQNPLKARCSNAKPKNLSGITITDHKLNSALSLTQQEKMVKRPNPFMKFAHVPAKKAKTSKPSVVVAQAGLGSTGKNVTRISTAPTAQS